MVLEPGLRERDAGEWSGLTRAEIERDWPGYLDSPPPTGTPASAAHRDPATVEQPKRRSDAGRRAGSRTTCCSSGWSTALGRVHDLAPDGEVIAITHGGVVYALEGRLGSPFERLANLGGRWIDVGPGGELRGLGDRVVLVDPDELTVPAQI